MENTQCKVNFMERKTPDSEPVIVATETWDESDAYDFAHLVDKRSDVSRSFEELHELVDDLAHALSNFHNESHYNEDGDLVQLDICPFTKDSTVIGILDDLIQEAQGYKKWLEDVNDEFVRKGMPR